MTRRVRSAVNRTVLGLAGLVLALAGSWLAATDRAVTGRLPSWWPAAAPGSVLLDRDRLAQLRAEAWWTPTLMAAAITLSVLLAYWSLARLRPGPARPLAFALPGGTVRPQALAEALSTRVAALPGVARSRSRVLCLPGRRLEIGLRIWLRPGASPDAVLPALCALTAEAEKSAAPCTARTRIRLSTAAPHRPTRLR
ncbi:hypothetical protein ABT090_17960 [Streptomyces asoensis]|uniref:hypothetical protein n=1 Tax=Streptomyces asoensis TaxID=249586 RepID=UPI0033165D39